MKKQAEYCCNAYQSRCLRPEIYFDGRMFSNFPFFPLFPAAFLFLPSFLPLALHLYPLNPSGGSRGIETCNRAYIHPVTNSDHKPELQSINQSINLFVQKCNTHWIGHQ